MSMIHHNLVQGSAEWLAYRAQHFNASDAPAMMGCSPYKTRDALLLELHTGLAAEVGADTQRIFDEGHRSEALARPLAEETIGQELYPVVGSRGKLSASFDGLTMLEDVGYEHKSLNAELRAAMVEGCTGGDLPLTYQVQMEQQCMVSGASRILFVASKWTADAELIEARHCWYTSSAQLAARITLGWEQFDRDLCAFVPPDRAPAVVAQTVTALPAVSVQVSGQLVVRDNFKAFEAAARDFIENKLIREPKTDQDFADLELQIKAMENAEEALDAAESQMLSQVQAVDEAKRIKDALHALIRSNRLVAVRLLKEEKERRRGEIVASGTTALRDHLKALNVRLGQPLMPAVAADFAGAIKGKKNLDSMQAAVNTTLANAKVEANAIADKIDGNLRALRAVDTKYSHLFPDTAQVVHKAADDLVALVKSRTADFDTAEAKRIEAERERIRKEELDRIDAENRAAAAIAAAAARPPAPAPTPTPEPAPAPQPAMALSAASTVARTFVRVAAPEPSDDGATLKLGEINAAIAPLSITTEGLRQFGFEPAGRERAAVLYRASDLPKMRAAMVAHLRKDAA
jgi:putative phage-type endonuclease